MLYCTIEKEDQYKSRIAELQASLDQMQLSKGTFSIDRIKDDKEKVCKV